MIVKNEEKVLPRILKPMKEIVDKILICDTGSTDRTKEIIREFTAEVYDFPWKNDFSAARNFISEKVSTDYWMWLDADDMITQENLYRLKQLKETLSPNTDMVMMDYVTDFDEWNHAAFSCYRERILKLPEISDGGEEFMNPSFPPGTSFILPYRLNIAK